MKFIQKKPVFLLLRNRKYWDAPKGKLDPGESFLEAALRETEEESNLSDLNFKWGFDFIETEPYKTRVEGKKRTKVARYYVAEVMSGEAEIKPNEDTGIKEHDEFRWVYYVEAIRLPLHKRMVGVLEWANGVVGEKDVDSVFEKQQPVVELVG